MNRCLESLAVKNNWRPETGSTVKSHELPCLLGLMKVKVGLLDLLYSGRSRSLQYSECVFLAVDPSPCSKQWVDTKRLYPTMNKQDGLL